MNNRDLIQNSPEWVAAKLGKQSASSAAVIMGGLETSGLATYIKRLAWERVYGATEEGFKSAAMSRGHELEPESLDWYAFTKDVVIERVGLIDHPTIAMVAASPDGLLSDRTIEAKNPLHSAWMEVKRTRQVPSEYRWQCRWAQWCAEKWLTDFVAYHPDAGGLIIPISVSQSECDQMAERAALVEKRIQEWIDILMDRRVAA